MSIVSTVYMLYTVYMYMCTGCLHNYFRLNLGQPLVPQWDLLAIIET